jgi:hypothetical protein
MNYNTEIINGMAKQVVEAVQEWIHTQPEATALNLQEIETMMRDLLRQVGRQALGQYLSAQPSIPGPSLACACGGEVHYQRQREASLLSVFGRVKYRRGYYAGCECGQGQVPLDKALGLTPGGVSAGLAELLALAGIELAFDQSRRWIEKYLLFPVSENTIRAATEERGARQQAEEHALQQHTQQESWLQDRLRTVSDIPKRLYGSIDAAKVRIEGRTPEEKAIQTEAWRDVKVGCWYQLERVPPSQYSRRQQHKYDREQAVYRATHLRYYCDIAEAKMFGTLLWARGCQVKADLAPELIFVCDGAVWIWKLVSLYYPQAVQIVDWYHALEHLEKVASLAFPSKASERQTWLEQTTEALWNGQIQDVIRACQALIPGDEKIQTEALYFVNNAERMDYAHFRAAGYAIGSGTVESACKQIVTQRLKKAGAQWLVDGAIRTAKARAAWLSGEWDGCITPDSGLPLAA